MLVQVGLRAFYVFPLHLNDCKACQHFGNASDMKIELLLPLNLEHVKK